MKKVSDTREKQLKLIQSYITRMPSLSTTVTKVLEICNSPRTSPNDLNRVISLDPVLTGRVLKLVNSTYYALSKKVTSLTRAIIMLGLNTVVNLVVSTAVLESMSAKGSFKSLSMDDFWTHSIGVGVTAKHLAALKGVSKLELEEYFLAGLLHDLGKIPLNNRFPEAYVLALDLVKMEQGPLYRAENSILGIDHSLVGKMISEKWQLSDALTDALFCHHGTNEAKEKNRRLSGIIALANTYTNLFDIGSAGDLYPEESKIYDLLDQVGVSWNEISGLSETVVDEIETAKIFLQVVKKD